MVALRINETLRDITVDFCSLFTNCIVILSTRRELMLTMESLSGRRAWRTLATGLHLAMEDRMSACSAARAHRPRGAQPRQESSVKHGLGGRRAA